MTFAGEGPEEGPSGGGWGPKAAAAPSRGQSPQGGQRPLRLLGLERGGAGPPGRGGGREARRASAP